MNSSHLNAWDTPILQNNGINSPKNKGKHLVDLNATFQLWKTQQPQYSQTIVTDNNNQHVPTSSSLSIVAHHAAEAAAEYMLERARKSKAGETGQVSSWDALTPEGSRSGDNDCFDSNIKNKVVREFWPLQASMAVADVNRSSEEMKMAYDSLMAGRQGACQGGRPRRRSHADNEATEEKELLENSASRSALTTERKDKRGGLNKKNSLSNVVLKVPPGLVTSRVRQKMPKQTSAFYKDLEKSQTVDAILDSSPPSPWEEMNIRRTSQKAPQKSNRNISPILTTRKQLKQSSPQMKESKKKSHKESSSTPILSFPISTDAFLSSNSAVNHKGESDDYTVTTAMTDGGQSVMSGWSEQQLLRREKLKKTKNRNRSSKKNKNSSVITTATTSKSKSSPQQRKRNFVFTKVISGVMRKSTQRNNREQHHKMENRDYSMPQSDSNKINSSNQGKSVSKHTETARALSSPSLDMSPTNKSQGKDRSIPKETKQSVLMDLNQVQQQCKLASQTKTFHTSTANSNQGNVPSNHAQIPQHLHRNPKKRIVQSPSSPSSDHININTRSHSPDLMAVSSDMATFSTPQEQSPPCKLEQNMQSTQLFHKTGPKATSVTHYRIKSPLEAHRLPTPTSVLDPNLFNGSDPDLIQYFHGKTQKTAQTKELKPAFKNQSTNEISQIKRGVTFSKKIADTRLYSPTQESILVRYASSTENDQTMRSFDQTEEDEIILVRDVSSTENEQTMRSFDQTEEDMFAIKSRCLMQDFEETNDSDRIRNTYGEDFEVVSNETNNQRKQPDKYMEEKHGKTVTKTSQYLVEDTDRICNTYGTDFEAVHPRVSSSNKTLEKLETKGINFHRVIERTNSDISNSDLSNDIPQISSSLSPKNNDKIMRSDESVSSWESCGENSRTSSRLPIGWPHRVHRKQPNTRSLPHTNSSKNTSDEKTMKELPRKVTNLAIPEERNDGHPSDEETDAKSIISSASSQKSWVAELESQLLESVAVSKKPGKIGSPTENEDDDNNDASAEVNAIISSVAAVVIQTIVRRWSARRIALDRMCAILAIQEHWRNYHGPRLIKRRINAVISIQSLWRGWYSRFWNRIDDHCATQMQRITRGYLANLRVQDHVFKIVTVQCIIRRFLAVKTAKRLKRCNSNIVFDAGDASCPRSQRNTAMRKVLCLMTLQSKFRQWKCQSDYRKMMYFATLIQSTFRGWWVRTWMHVDEYCATQIQRISRGHAAKKSYHFMIHDIIVVQSVIRRRMAQDESCVRFFSVVLVQACFRGFRTRYVIPRQHCDDNATLIQTQWRRFSYLLRFQFLIVDIITIQAVVRRWSCIRDFRKLRKCISYMPQWKQQRFLQSNAIVRQKEETKNLRIHQSDAAVVIQSQWRAYYNNINFIMILADIMLVQSAVRRYITRRYYGAYLKSLHDWNGDGARYVASHEATYDRDNCVRSDVTFGEKELYRYERGHYAQAKNHGRAHGVSDKILYTSVSKGEQNLPRSDTKRDHLTESRRQSASKINIQKQERYTLSGAHKNTTGNYRQTQDSITGTKGGGSENRFENMSHDNVTVTNNINWQKWFHKLS